MRKGSDGEKMEKKWKIMTLIMATKVLASRPPQRWPTGTPTVRAEIVANQASKKLSLAEVAFVQRIEAYKDVAKKGACK